ncbi:hypothetical protein IPM09_03065 [Candidatus Saccharibacteria bacterium]|nr:MAG: hypothetical protein IPM09_03065 [Candidatus Saccharibacteria bacterium]
MLVNSKPRRDEEDAGVGSSGDRTAVTPQDAPLNQPPYQAGAVSDVDPCELLPSPDEAWRQLKPAVNITLDKLVQAFMLALKTQYKGPGTTLTLDGSGLQSEALYFPARDLFVKRLRHLGWEVVIDGLWAMKITHRSQNRA